MTGARVSSPSAAAGNPPVVSDADGLRIANSPDLAVCTQTTNTSGIRLGSVRSFCPDNLILHSIMSRPIRQVAWWHVICHPIWLPSQTTNRPHFRPRCIIQSFALTARSMRLTMSLPHSTLAAANAEDATEL
jgi:hypothetical protein